MRDFWGLLIGRQKRQNSTTRVIEPISSLEVGGTGNNSSIISVASFSWVWWVHGVMLVTFTAYRGGEDHRV